MYIVRKLYSGNNRHFIMASKKDYTNVKILISYQEYDRLKKIEKEFVQSQDKEQSSSSEKNLKSGGKN